MEIIRQHFIKIDSTNTWAKVHAEELKVGALTVVSADEQTAGRGRFKRKWVSPAGENIYSTFCFFLPNLREDLGNIPQVLSLSVITILEGMGFSPRLKWPNDILLSGKKLAGILCETTPSQQQFLVVVGIGLNVNMSKDQLQQIDRPATSLLNERGTRFDVADIHNRLIDQYSEDLDKFMKEGFSPFYTRYVEKSAYMHGDSLKFNDNKKIWEGAFECIQRDGSLMLKLSSGESKRFTVGEIFDF